MRTLSELGLTEKDFSFEMIDIGDAEYNDQFNPFMPSRQLVCKINGFTFKIISRVNIELLEDLKCMRNIDIDKELEKILKEEAISSFINNNQFIRKLKLKKIKEKYEK